MQTFPFEPNNFLGASVESSVRAQAAVGLVNRDADYSFS